jgi:hypothetical protein
VSSPKWFLIKVFNETILIQEDVVLPDFSLAKFFKGNIIQHKVAI